MNITILNTFGDEITKISYPQLDSRNLLENRKLAEKAGEKTGYRMYGGKSKLTFVEGNVVDDEEVMSKQLRKFVAKLNDCFL